jgi:dipeptidyl aminopeptidase/acylaminoacyl peptidase
VRALAIAGLALAACNFSGGSGAGADLGGDGGDGDSPDAAVAVSPRCDVSAARVICDPEISTITAGNATREIYWQTPASPPPAAGYPLVVVFQGSFYGPDSTWGTVTADTPFGGYHQARLQAVLLENGFTVIAPRAAGGVAWQTNSGIPWSATTDRLIIDALLGGIAAGDFGPADTSRLHATGISSGGYMTSRMAVSYDGVFRSLAIASASYATCAGFLCAVPDTMPSDHPPTLFLHGELDLTVPISTAESYLQVLQDTGIATAMISDAGAGHEWLASAPEEILDWFRRDI